MQPESSDGLASVGTILPEERAAQFWTAFSVFAVSEPLALDFCELQVKARLREQTSDGFALFWMAAKFPGGGAVRRRSVLLDRRTGLVGMRRVRCLMTSARLYLQPGCL